MDLTPIQKSFLNKKLNSLSKSKFRSNFHLKEKDKIYIKEKGIDIIEKHCYDFIRTRLAAYPLPNDGKQTPMKGHPVFIAQHATATCCRSCLNKWYKIPKTRNLSEKEIVFIKALIMEWLNQHL